MDWQKIWSDFAASSENAMLQVGRTLNKVPMSEELIDEIITDIVIKTHITKIVVYFKFYQKNRGVLIFCGMQNTKYLYLFRILD